VVAVDDRLDPLRDAIIWLDRRAVAETEALTTAVGADALFTTTGLAPDASHTAPKMMSTLAAAGAWGFTIGSAIFEGRLPGGPDVAAQVRAVLAVAAGT
jgi:hypothetical protein